MRKPEQSAEPSIEEILASIRKIIADDGSQPPARAATLAEVPETPQRRRDPEPPRRPLPHPVEAFYPEPAEPAAAFGEDDDILELTEDSMVEDGAAQSATAFADPMAPADVRQFEPLQASSLSGRSAPPSGEELESAFSSVVAEVQRLSGGLKPAAEIGAASQDWAEPAITPPPKAPRQAPVDEPWDAPATAAEPALRPAPTRPAQPQARPASKPVWSARRLDSEGPRVRTPAEDSPAGKPEPAPRQNMAGQEGWAEGVQMRVPEGGPATPFPQSELLEGDTDDGDTAPPLSGSGESHSEIDKEKTFVGEMLTRVFGGAQKKAPEAPPAPPSRQPHADVRLAKAEDLAKATIADFASDKLRAPSVAQALHADRPFMDAITDSLATAMAEVEADSDSRTSARAAAAAQPDDELADAMLPPDIEAGMFGAPEQPSATVAQAPFGNPFARQPGVAPPFAEPPELPRGHSGDAFAEPEQTSRQTHSEIFGAAPEVDRAAPAAMPARTPSKPEPTAMMKSATAPADHAASPGAAFPAGLEDSIKDMIKPLIVQWLNDNLPRIVERAVREEISDQGLVGRVRGEGGSRH